MAVNPPTTPVIPEIEALETIEAIAPHLLNNPQIDVSADDKESGHITDNKADNWRIFEATSYTAKCNGCIGITKSGYDVRNTVYSPNGHRVIAVDPNVIEIGTLVEIRLADGTTFKARALDTGGAIKGNRIDLLKSKRSKALEFGRQDVELRVISE